MSYVRLYVLMLVVLMALFLGAIMDSRHRGRNQDALRDLKGISRLIPSGDPGVNNSARYIRHLGMSTPASAFPDFPGQRDYLPSGMMWPPPSSFPGLTTRLPITVPGADGKD